MNRGAVAEIRLKDIAANLRTVKKLVKKRPVISVVKADAYGHGAVEVSRILLRYGTYCLAVAFTSEAIELREAGIKAPILVLFDRGDVRQFFDFRLIPVVYSTKTALSFSKEAKKRRSLIKIHVKVDTGMGRLGLSNKNVINEIIGISELEGLDLAGIMSHFSEADLADRSFAGLQLERFLNIRKKISTLQKAPVISHIANSAGVLYFRKAYLDAVRPGIMLYGYLPNSESLRNEAEKEYNLIPAMRVTSRILCIRRMPTGTPISYGRTFITKRKSLIGVIPLGYADGYSRLFSNNAEVLIRGKRVPVVGRVCMDLTMVDLTDIKGVRENDEVIVLGNQGRESITAYELASRANTIPYEILTSLGNKSRRTYTL